MNRFLTWTQLTVLLLHGRDRHCLMIKWSSGKSQSTCLLRLHAVSGEDVNSQRSNFKMGRSSGRILDVRYFFLENCWRIDGATIEFERHCRFLKKSRMICKSGTLNLKNSQTESSCQCSTMKIGREKETMRCTSNSEKSRRTRRISRKDTGRSSVLETKRSGMENQSTSWNTVEFRSFIAI